MFAPVTAAPGESAAAAVTTAVTPGMARETDVRSWIDLPYCAPLKDRRCDVASGTVKWFNPTKGYGFIQPSGGGGKDVFVHISAVERAGLSTLNEGQQVEYEIVSNRGKESAENLKVK
jgi:cold shock protein